MTFNKTQGVALKPIYIILTATLALGVTMAWGANSPASAIRPLTPAEELELKTISAQLTDPLRDTKTKAEAGDLLLTKPYPQAAELAKSILADSSNPSAQIAIADAIGRLGGTVELIEPLLAMLASPEPDVRAIAAKALVTYKQQKVTERLVNLALDEKLDKAVRQAAISTLQGVLDKQAVDALVKLVNDRDMTIRHGAMDALTKLTNIRTFGRDRSQWVLWWNQNKNKDRNEWLADLAESLGKTKAALDGENAQLRDRLSKALLDLYGATPVAQRDALLMSLLKEPLADVRLGGMTLVQNKIESSLIEEISPEVRSQVRLMLSDTSAEIRQSAAIVLASLGQANTLAALMEQLKVEESPSVQAALLSAMGQLHEIKALPTVMANLYSRYDIVAAAAATALGRIALRQPLQDMQRSDAVRAIIERYRSSETPNGSGVALREALLVTMGSIADNRFSPVLMQAMKDSAATIRWSAVNSMAKLADPVSADTIAPLMADPDRGVRQAAIVAVASLAGEKYLPVILQRTEAIESEETVRQQAWDSAMAILAAAREETLVATCESLAKRPEASNYFIRTLQALVDKLKAGKSPALAGRQRQLAAALIAADRPAEAAIQLADVYLAMSGHDPHAAEMWIEWVDAMIAAADPALARVIAGQNDQKLFVLAVEHLATGVAVMVDKNKHDSVLGLLEEVDHQLGSRLNDEQRQTFSIILNNCRTRQAHADQQRVTKLALQLLSTEEQARKAAVTELTAMGDRAVTPLVGELRRNIASPKPNPELEVNVLSILKQVAPRLTGYNISAPPAQKVQIVEGWLSKKAVGAN